MAKVGPENAHVNLESEMETMKIEKLTMDHVDKVFQFMIKEYCSDEPVFSSFGIMKSTDCLGKMLFDKETKKEVVIDPIKSGHSFGAFDENENLMGIKLGKIITKENFQNPVSMNCVLSFPDCMLSKSVLSNVYGMQFFEWMEYTEDLTFGHCEENNGRIYECVVLGVAKKDRQKGLGDKLVKHALNYAREQDCSHAHTLASGVFSQKIMKNNGFEVILEKNYEDFKDKHGNVLVEHDIHKTAQINVLKL